MRDFVFKPFDEMTPQDYKEVGFKSGLEIHQQIHTEKKLFCRCPAGKYSEKYDAEILRHMRPTLSELGEYDGTALMEFKTKKEILYRINRETVCTYEMDDTPPFLMNERALDIALGIGLLYNCNLVDELHIARKQYLDGSIPTGFQRTAIFALDGHIPYKNRSIKIVQMSIEEDSCREVSDQGHVRVYLTDRLGMPLIETVTGPDMKTPQEVAEVASVCSGLVRSTGNVRRGMGAAREDVNVSVRGGTRIEIKGVPKISSIPLLTYNEAMRQWNLLRLRDELNKRGINKKTFESKIDDVTAVIKNPYYLPIKTAIDNGFKIKCVVLKNFAGLLRWQTQTDTYFSKEISDRVRVIACLTTIPNIIHSDSVGDNLTSSEWFQVKKAVGASKEDSLVLVWGDERDTNTAANEIAARAHEATIGIPSETRQALRDGTNGFERILPGADRMYPDTDLPPKKVTKARVQRIKASIPEQFWKREKRYRGLRIPEDTVRPLAISKLANLFDKAVLEWGIDPVLAAVSLIQYPKRLKRKGLDIRFIDEPMMEGILKAFKDKLISKDGILYVIEESVKLGGFYPEMLPPPCLENELKEIIKESEIKAKQIDLREKGNYHKLAVGYAMRKLRMRVDGARVAKIIKPVNPGE